MFLIIKVLNLKVFNWCTFFWLHNIFHEFKDAMNDFKDYFLNIQFLFIFYLWKTAFFME